MGNINLCFCCVITELTSATGSPLVVDLSIDILEALELEQVLVVLSFPDVLGLDELLGLYLGLRVTDLDVIASRLAHLFVVLQTLVSVLQVSARRLSEVVPNNTLDWRLRSIRTAKSKLLIG